MNLIEFRRFQAFRLVSFCFGVKFGFFGSRGNSRFDIFGLVMCVTNRVPLKITHLTAIIVGIKTYQI